MAGDKKKKERNTFLKGHVWWKYVVSVLAIIIYLLPIWVVFVVATKPLGDNSTRLAITSGLYLGNFEKALFRGNMLNAIKNSAIIMLGVIVVEVVMSAFAAYPLSRNRSRLNKFIMTIILAVMMIPGLSIVVGVYMELVSFHMISSYWGIILITAAFGLPMCIYLYSNFIRTIPASLDEAAAIDGASAGQTFFRILLPQLKPVTVTVIIMRGIGAWNEYMYSLYILQKPQMYNVSLTIKQFFSENLSDYGAAAAAAFMAIIPVIVIYLFLQKYFIQGQLDSAVKG